MERTLITAPASVAIPISDKSEVGEARRLIGKLATEIGLSAEDRSRVELLVTELGTNLAKHARQGELVARSFFNEGGVGVLIHSVDHGPGMRNLDECQNDGFSTAGSSGIGLGTLRRKADTFEIYSLEKVGTVIAVSVIASPAPAKCVETGLLIAPAPKEVVSGDGCAITGNARQTTFTIVDGLGHGPNAADAANEALRIAHEERQRSPSDLILSIHEALKKTRGAAVAIARIDLDAGSLTFCSVGNISAVLVNYGRTKTLPTGNGIVGHILPRIETVEMPWTGRDLLVMHSDGLHAHTKVYNQPGLLVRPPALIAGMLYAQQKRGRDDCAVLVARALSQ